jgi:hypothetical protein
MNNAPNDRLIKLERAIHALGGIGHGIASALETESGITPMQINCMIGLVTDALFESLSELGGSERIRPSS